MIEQIFKLTKGNDKTIERLIADENINYNHMILGQGERLPEHFSNSTVYMTVVRGSVSIGLGDQNMHKYEAGTILKIPVDTKMKVTNEDEDTLELIVIKAPAPKA